MSVRPQVQRLVDLGPMPDARSDPDPMVVQEYVDALDALPGPLTDQEAIALLDTFPPGEDSGLFGVEWSVLHAIESAPYGEDLLRALDDRSEWVTYLRERAERGGIEVRPPSP